MDNVIKNKCKSCKCKIDIIYFSEKTDGTIFEICNLCRLDNKETKEQATQTKSTQTKEPRDMTRFLKSIRYLNRRCYNCNTILPPMTAWEILEREHPDLHKCGFHFYLNN